MSVHKDQPAFPATEEHGCNVGWSGMSLRQYAAIKLKVADSGVDWLDEMIIKSKRDGIAEKAMAALKKCEFALEVTRRAVADEREACAIIGARAMEAQGIKAGGKIWADGQVIADAIRARSNAK